MTGQGNPVYPVQTGLVQTTQAYYPAANGSWSTGLCSWCSPPGNTALCCRAAFCCCCQYGLNTEKLGPQATCGGNCCGGCCFYWLMCSIGLHFVPQCITRGEIRRMHGMQPGSCSDCMTAWCCGSCGLCQENREIAIRGPPGVTKQTVYVNAPPQQQMIAQSNY